MGWGTTSRLPNESSSPKSHKGPIKGRGNTQDAAIPIAGREKEPGEKGGSQTVETKPKRSGGQVEAKAGPGDSITDQKFPAVTLL